MLAIFVELPAFERHRARYLDDDQYIRLQEELLANPEAGDVIRNTGGLRKMRFGDTRRGKGKRGGLRVLYYYWAGGPEYWLFTLFDKNEMTDLKPAERVALHVLLKTELKMRRQSQ